MSNEVEIVRILQDLRSRLGGENEKLLLKLKENKKNNEDLRACSANKLTEMLESGKDALFSQQSNVELIEFNVSSYIALDSGCAQMFQIIQSYKEQFDNLKDNVLRHFEYSIFDKYTTMNFHDVEAQLNHLRALASATKIDIAEIKEELVWQSGELPTKVRQLQDEMDGIISYVRDSSTSKLHLHHQLTQKRTAGSHT